MQQLVCNWDFNVAGTYEETVKGRGKSIGVLKNNATDENIVSAGIPVTEIVNPTTA